MHVMIFLQQSFTITSTTSSTQSTLQFMMEQQTPGQAGQQQYILLAMMHVHLSGGTLSSIWDIIGIRNTVLQHKHGPF